VHLETPEGWEVVDTCYTEGSSLVLAVCWLPGGLCHWRPPSNHQSVLCYLVYCPLSVPQVDEPALREGLPLKKDKWDGYLGWAVDAFR
jgi:hypothetical protein